MKRILTIMVILMAAVAAMGSWFDSLQAKDTDQPKIVETGTVVAGPDAETIIKTTAGAIRAQNKLLVMTAQTNAVATAQIHEMGMSANQIDVGSAEAQYFVNLESVDQNHILSTEEKLTITLPRSSLVIKLLPVTDEESLDNGSWLFTFKNGLKADLSKSNKGKIQSKLYTQAEELKGQAEINAKLALKSLFEIPLHSAGFKQDVEIIFL